MKFNLFLLLLTIFAVVALAYPNDQRTGTNLLKRQRNPNCRMDCCTPGNDKCVQECGKPTCTCNPKASCCRNADQTCKDVVNSDYHRPRIHKSQMAICSLIWFMGQRIGRLEQKWLT
ncbi:3697_t:CDS:2 [Funneliformis caledonium]|uniref:3697_t:CDS:1 n=1 Tax=Funneliformis caledonium TaxID=1117310 RepID=A0A9N8ZQU3_9GLOM|nr:3697_t:CDS:2 [Funneliformis caledonium]